VKLSFTGTQEGMSENQLEEVARFFRQNEVTAFHHGDCVGADAEAHHLAVSAGVSRIIIHPPMDSKKRAWCGWPEDVERDNPNIISISRDIGPIGFPQNIYILPVKEYLDRNRDIVDDGEILIAAPFGKEVRRSGTWYTIRYARRIGREVHTLPR